jgi:predicted DNA-binding protein
MPEHMERTDGGEQMQQHQIRMNDELKERITAYQKKLTHDTGARVSFSEAVRALLEKSLKAARV